MKLIGTSIFNSLAFFGAFGAFVSAILTNIGILAGFKFVPEALDVLTIGGSALAVLGVAKAVKTANPAVAPVVSSAGTK